MGNHFILMFSSSTIVLMGNCFVSHMEVSWNRSTQNHPSREPIALYWILWWLGDPPWLKRPPWFPNEIKARNRRCRPPQAARRGWTAHGAPSRPRPARRLQLVHKLWLHGCSMEFIWMLYLYTCNKYTYRIINGIYIHINIYIYR